MVYNLYYVKKQPDPSLARVRLGKLLRNIGQIMTVTDVARTFEIKNAEASNLLSKWCKQGWMARVKRGLYIAIPLDATSGESALPDPFILCQVSCQGSINASATLGVQYC